MASMNGLGVKGVAPELPPGSGAGRGTALSMVPSSLVQDSNFGIYFGGWSQSKKLYVIQSCTK